MTPVQETTPRERQIAAILVALGAATLGTGLLLGPTPSADAAQALRDIDGFRTWYVMTNAIDLCGVLLLASGLLAVARAQVAFGGGLLPILGGVGNALGGALIALVVVLQSSVDTGVAGRFVNSSGVEQAMHLAVGRVVIEIDGAIFGVGFLLQMLGIASVALTFMIESGPRFSRGFLLLGVLLAGGASLMGIAAQFEDAFGRIEAVLGLFVLAWLVVLSAILWRRARAGW